MSLDFDKPIRTRDGRKVRILCTDAEGLEDGETIVALVEGVGEPLYYHSDGRFIAVSEDRRDLVNYDPGYTKVMVLLSTPDGGVVARQADAVKLDSYKKLGDFRVTIKDGKLLKVELL